MVVLAIDQADRRLFESKWVAQKIAVNRRTGNNPYRIVRPLAFVAVRSCRTTFKTAINEYSKMFLTDSNALSALAADFLPAKISSEEHMLG
jgi:hypothetical protein